MNLVPFGNIDLGTMFKRYSQHSKRWEWCIKTAADKAYCPMNSTKINAIPETYLARVL